MPSITRSSALVLSASGLASVRVTLSVAVSYFAERTLTTGRVAGAEPPLFVGIDQTVNLGLVRLGGVDRSAECHIQSGYHALPVRGRRDALNVDHRRCRRDIDGHRGRRTHARRGRRIGTIRRHFVWNVSVPMYPGSGVYVNVPVDALKLVMVPWVGSADSE